MPQSFHSPGAAATNSLFDFLAEREARRRQDMLDEITKSTASRQDEVARGQLDLQREQLTSLQEQRQAAAELSRQKKALGVIGMLSPDSNVDADTADVIKQGGFGSLIREAQSSVQRDTPNGPADDPRSWVDPTSVSTFAGTPQQQALRRFIEDPNTTPEQRAFMEARLAAGDENLPYQLFQGPETQALFRVSNNRRGIERFENGAWVPHDGAIPKDAHWLTEPNPATGEAADMRRIGMFNRIADAYERSPLVKAADRTIVLSNTAERILKDNAAASNASTQLNLAYSYIQALDTYQSAVREGELANLGALGTKLEVIGANIIRYLPREAGGQGQVMSPQVAREIATEGKRLVELIESGRQRKASEFQRRANASGVADLWDATYPSAPPTTTPTSTPAPSTTAPANPFRR
jgi:hypothetical protein